VGRWEGMAVFVPHTVTGDRVRVELVKQRHNYLQGSLQEIKEPSPWRVMPPCPHYGLCGGCQWEEIAYPYQLTIKEHQVVELFRRIGQQDPVPIGEAIPSPSPWHYRGKMEFHAVKRGKRRLVGLKAEKSNEIVNLSRCLLAHETINRSLVKVRHDTVIGRIPLWSDDEINAPCVARHVKGETFLVPRTSFFQANIFLLESLVDLVLEFAALDGSETVVDAYCGVGFFTRFLARKARRVVGIEVDEQAIRVAEEQLAQHGHQKISFIAGSVEDVLTALGQKMKQGVSLVVVDPPRLGLSHQALTGIFTLSPRRIIYVSCNPATMARDGVHFTRQGYQLTQLIPVDMFPQTAHIEVVGRWDKKGDGG